jgi:hypothetical protein
VVVLEASNEETEALGVVNEIVDLIERKGINTAILPFLSGKFSIPVRRGSVSAKQNTVPHSKRHHIL